MKLIHSLNEKTYFAIVDYYLVSKSTKSKDIIGYFVDKNVIIYNNKLKYKNVEQLNVLIKKFLIENISIISRNELDNLHNKYTIIKYKNYNYNLIKIIAVYDDLADQEYINKYKLLI